MGSGDFLAGREKMQSKKDRRLRIDLVLKDKAS